MAQTFEFLIAHGYVVLFVVGFVEQIGLPFPALPFLLAAGALSIEGRLQLGWVIAMLVVSSLIADLIWYAIGRTRGLRVLNLICRVSLEPDSCVRRTEDLFARYGARALLVAKYVPGLNTAAPPLAGIFGMPLARFLLYDTIGALLWATGPTLVGCVFAEQLIDVLQWVSRVGGGAGLLAGLLVLYALFKFFQRHRFIRGLRIARVTPEELKARLDRGEDVVVVDLRHEVDVEADPERLPGALAVDPEEVESRLREVPSEREIVFYCT